MGKGPDKKQRTRKKMTPHDHARRKEEKQMLSKEKKRQFIGHLSKSAVSMKEPDDSSISEDDEQPKEDFSYNSSSSSFQNFFSIRKHVRIKYQAKRIKGSTSMGSLPQIANRSAGIQARSNSVQSFVLDKILAF